MLGVFDRLIGGPSSNLIFLDSVKKLFSTPKLKKIIGNFTRTKLFKAPFLTFFCFGNWKEKRMFHIKQINLSIIIF